MASFKFRTNADGKIYAVRVKDRGWWSGENIGTKVDACLYGTLAGATSVARRLAKGVKRNRGSDLRPIPQADIQIVSFKLTFVEAIGL